MLLSCIAICVFATLYEGFKVLREKLAQYGADSLDCTKPNSTSPSYGTTNTNQMILAQDSTSSPS